MFITNTDWEFSDAASVKKAGESMWPTMQAAGALVFYAFQTSDTSGRTTIVWPDAAVAHAAIDDLRAAASKLADMKVVGSVAGEVMVHRS